MAVLTRSALEGSPLADLHVIAGEVGIDGFRKLRKAELVDAILAKQGGEDTGIELDDDTPDESAEVDEAVGDDVVVAEEVEVGPVTPPSPVGVDDEVETEEEAASRGSGSGDGEGRSRRRRGGRGRKRDEDEGGSGDRGGRERGERGGRERGGRGGRSGGGRNRSEEPTGRGGDDNGADEEKTVEGVVELLGNGSAFLRLDGPEPSDDDVYVSAAQVRRCELVSGDKVAGPVRKPRRSERYPSLVRVETINGRSADEVSEGTPFDNLGATFPNERLALGAEDPTLKAIEWLTPLGRGSRAVIAGPSRAGKSEALRRLGGALSATDGIELSVVLAGVRPEEIGEWEAVGAEPSVTLSFAASPDQQAQAVERAVDTAKRLAARGDDAVVLIDSLSYVQPAAARRILAAARNISGGGSLTIIATADAPLGGETTVIVLDPALTTTGRFPALDLVASGTLRPELLVGDAGAEAIAQARASALG